MIDAINITKKYLKTVQDEGIPITAAYLFGSHAKGKIHKFSDIDVCVISSSFGKSYFDEAVKLRKIATKVDSKIEPVPLTIKDLNDKYNTLAFEIRKYGIRVDKWGKFNKITICQKIFNNF